MAGAFRRRKLAIILTVLLFCGLTARISLAGQNMPVSGQGQDSIAEETLESSQEAASPAYNLSLQEAVKMAMTNNPDVLTVAQDVYLREQDYEKADYFADKIKQVDNDASYGEDMLSVLKQQLAAIPDPNDPAYKATYDYLQAQITEIETGLEEAEPYRINNYENAKVAHLYRKQAETGLNLTRIGKQVVEQKIALLVSKQYFDVIKYQQLAEVKKAALNRAVKQCEIAENTYEVGFRPKDDFLLAKAQSELMKADFEKSLLDLENAEADLRETIGMDQNTKIKLAPWKEDKVEADLDKALQQGQNKRLEIKKAAGELEIARLNYEIAGRYMGPGVVDYEKAKIEVRKGEIEVDRQKAFVEKDIRQAYQSLTRAENMVAQTSQTVERARESADIAEYRYSEGYGLPSPILKALNAEDLAGTMVEVLAAQEKLMEIEEKVIEITYSYNLAKANFLVSIGEGL